MLWLGQHEQESVHKVVLHTSKTLSELALSSLLWRFLLKKLSRFLGLAVEFEVALLE